MAISEGRGFSPWMLVPRGRRRGRLSFASPLVGFTLIARQGGKGLGMPVWDLAEGKGDVSLKLLLQLGFNHLVSDTYRYLGTEFH